jgi:uroporphyrinogen-III synthase
MNPCNLGGAGVLVTRPSQQAGELARKVRDIGGEPLLLPGLEIVECDDGGALTRDLDTTDIVIFVSRNAAQIGGGRIVSTGGFPGHVRVAAIGRGTGAELERLGLADIIVPPSGFDSEALADCQAFSDVGGKSVLIVRGQGGREQLASILSSRGARVRYAECYRRQLPAYPPQPFDAWWQAHRPAAWTATSAEIVDNLVSMAGSAGRPLLCGSPLFVPHARIAARAFSHAIATIFVTAPGDDGMASGLARWFCRTRALST